MRSIAAVLGIAILHFALSMVGIVVGIRAAFATQGGGGFWAAPLAVLLAHLSALLLAPLPVVRAFLPAEWRGGYIEIATVSVLFGTVVVGVVRVVGVVGRRGGRRA